ncbi:MAG: sulfatase-like hydrolase/transferase [Spirochaetes bacterium]|nr:sulfatase-like hydrolase/transferase [Spirochaetota bacterium]
MKERVYSVLAAYRTHAAIQNFNALFAATTLLYRVGLVIVVLFSEAPPLGVGKDIKTLVIIFLLFAADLFALAVFNIFFFSVAFIFSLRRYSARMRKVLQWGGFTAVLMLLFWHLVLTDSHLNLLINMNTGFTWSLFMEFFGVLSLKDFVSLMTLRDFLTLLLPIAVFFVLSRYRARLVFRLRVFALVITITLTFFAVATALGARRLPEEIRLNPHAYFLRDALRTLNEPRVQSKKHTGQGSSVFLADALFANGKPDDRGGALHANGTNVVIIILESTASEYIFDTTKYTAGTGKMPMPYLFSLVPDSLYMVRHFASNNSSPRSIFSIFSGLYESPETKFFAMERNLKIPQLLNYLGKNYSSFLVTPADLDWYFPKVWFKNRGFTQLNDYRSLKFIPEYKAGPTAVRDEFKSVDYFLTLAQKSTKPFLGVYYTFVGHWPYPDLSAEHKLIAADSSRSRYVNNLFAQDQVIRQIIEGLKQSAKLENTVVVIVGDHGEAFYQHPGNRVHSGESYNENIAAPLIIYAPQRVKPQRIESPSVHADIVPTLLDILGVRYRGDAFQGESLLRPLKRRYIFTYGNENTLTTVARDLNKMQILRKTRTCRHFDLAHDAVEQNNLNCATDSEQYRALEAFFNRQPGILRDYNELCNREGC